ncbi:MAG: DUF971 domain-containing protein [Methylovirgula sp.]|nr:DUF971 domain-containing protein [Methylovirgula sp.]
MTYPPCHTPKAQQWPRELRLSAGGKLLKVAFESGRGFELPAEYLRVMSPSAEVQGHGPQERKTLGGKRNVAITGVEPVGSYAVRLSFDDLHTTGIYTWDYLYELGARQTEKWSQYLAELETKGLSRDRPGEK